MADLTEERMMILQLISEEKITAENRNILKPGQAHFRF